jgi:hypothetical protein
MAETITVELDTRAFAASLRLTEQRMNQAMAKALNRTAFEVLEAERAEAARAFHKASGRGLQLLAGKGSFRFDAATPSNLVATVRPNENVPKRLLLLSQHERGGTIFPTKDRLGLKQDFLAVPTGVKRGAGGKVPARLLPATLLANSRKRRRKGTFFGTVAEKRAYQRAARAFVAIGTGGSGAILERRGTGSSSRTFSLYALIPKAQLPAIFHWGATAVTSARKWFPTKAREEIHRALTGRKA